MTREHSRRTKALVLAVLMITSAFAGVAAFGGSVAAAGNTTTIVVDEAGGSGVDHTTIQAALDNASAGDTIEVRQGVYEETIRVSTADVSLIADDGVEISPTESDIDSRGRIVDIEASGVTVEGFSVVGLGTDLSDPVGIYTSGADTTIVGNDVTNVLTAVQTSQAGSDGATIEGNTISNVGVGVSVQSNATTVEGNDISDAGLEGIGIIAGGSDGYTVRTDNTIRNNTIDVNGVPDVNVYFGSLDELNGVSGTESEVVSELIQSNDGIDTVVIKSSGDVYDGSIENVDSGTVHTTVQGAIDAAGTGDTIEVENGTYDGFTVDKAVTIAGEGEDVLVQGQVDVPADAVTLRNVTWNDSYSGDGPLLNVSGNDVLLEHIELDNVPTNHGTSIDIRGDDVTLTESTLTRSGDEGYALVHLYRGPNSVEATGSPTGVEITDNVISGGDIGVFLQAGQSVTIEGNEITPASSDDDAIWVTGVAYGSLSEDATLDIQNNGELVEVDNATTGTVHYMTSVSAAFASDQSPIGDGSTVWIPDGTYTLSEQAEIPADNVTVEGESPNGVVIDGSGVPWPIYAHNKSDVTLRNLTVYGYNGGSSPDDTVKLAFIDGLLIENVAVNGSAGNEFDLNNVRDATLRNVEANGEDTGGVGVALTAVQNATLENVDTRNNSWGGVGLYDASDTVQSNYPEGWTLMRNTSDVTVAASSDLSEDVSLYSDQEYGGTLGDVHAPAYEYAVVNPDHRAGGENFTFFFRSRDAATEFALALGSNQSSTVQTLEKDQSDEIDLGSTFVVEDGMSIQAGVDAADAGDTVLVGPGTYEENVVVDSSITLRGAGAGQTVIAPDSGNPVTVKNDTGNGYTKIDDVTVRDVTLDSPDSSSIGLIAISTAGDGDNETGSLTVENVVVEGGIASFGVFDTEQATFHNVTARDVESDIGAFEVGGVGDLTIVDSRIENTTTGVKFNDFTGLDYEETGSLTITGTTFNNTELGVNVTAGIDADAVTLRENTFVDEGQSSDTAVAVENNGAGTVTATHNYWGAPSGPSGEFGGSGAAVSGNVTVQPFYVDEGLSSLSKAVNSSTVQNDTATVVLTGGNASSVDVSLPAGTNATSVTVTEASAPTGNATDVSSERDVAVYLDIDAGVDTNENVTVSVTVSLSALEAKGIDPADVAVLHFTDGNWTELETDATVQGDQVRLETTASGLSPFAVAQATTTVGDGDDGSTDGVDEGAGSGDGGSAPPNLVRTSITGGQAHLTVGAEVSELSVYFREGGSEGSVSARPLDARPDSVPAIPDATGVAFVDVSVPAERTDSEATLEFTVEADAVDDTDPTQLTVYHYHDGEWSALETTVVSTEGGEVVLEATTPGFSLFAVGADQQQTDAPDDTTDQPDDTPTDAPDDTTDQPDDSTDAPDDTTEGPVQEPGGFDFGALAVALLIIVVLVSGYAVWARSE